MSAIEELISQRESYDYTTILKNSIEPISLSGNKKDIQFLIDEFSKSHSYQKSQYCQKSLNNIYRYIGCYGDLALIDHFLSEGYFYIAGGAAYGGQMDLIKYIDSLSQKSNKALSSDDYAAIAVSTLKMDHMNTVREIQDEYSITVDEIAMKAKEFEVDGELIKEL